MMNDDVLLLLSQAARIGSGFFLVLQLILLIHFVYEVRRLPSGAIQPLMVVQAGAPNNGCAVVLTALPAIPRPRYCPRAQPIREATPLPATHFCTSASSLPISVPPLFNEGPISPSLTYVATPRAAKLQQTLVLPRESRLLLGIISTASDPPPLPPLLLPPQVSEWLVAKDNGCAWSLLIIGSCICFGLGLVLIGLSYYYFAPSGSCRCGEVDVPSGT